MRLFASRRAAALAGLGLGLAACSSDQRAVRAESEEGMWRRVGEELAGLASPLPDVARVLLIRQEIKPDFDLGPGQDLMEQSFRATAARRMRGTPEIVTVALPAMAKPSPTDLRAGGGYRVVEAAFLTETLKRGGPYQLVVSLLREPAGAPPPGGSWPPVICFTWEGSPALADGLRSGVIAGAVAPRHDVPARGEKDWFALRYTVLTKANVYAWLSAGPPAR